ncbi:MAG: T9SS type A sorting domain-containing protein [Candidatus Krumholzibacteria bacterium]|nr:T9SS type A sorting domain-containing protein [Candidatus Krumholzibacteria bacterium]
MKHWICLAVLCLSLPILAEPCENWADHYPNPVPPILEMFGNGSSGASAISGDRLYVSDGVGLKVYDISDPEEPLILYRINSDDDTSGLFIHQNILYLMHGAFDALVYDIQGSGPPVPLPPLGVSGYTRRMTASGDTLYAAIGYGGIKAFDVSDPANITTLGTYNSPGFSWGIHVEDGIAYLAETSSGLRILDLGDLSDIQVLSEYATLGNAYDVELVGDYLMIAENDSALEVVDVSDPSNPVMAGHWDVAADIDRLELIDENMLLLSIGYTSDELESGLSVLDVSDPANPTLHSQAGGQGSDFLCFSENLACLSHQSNGLELFEISNLSDPFLINSFGEAANWILGIADYGDYVLAADYRAGVRVFDLSGLPEVSEVATLASTGNPYGITVSGDLAYVPAYSAGLEILDISDPLSPSLLSVVPDLGYTIAVAVAGNIVAMADKNFGIQLVDVDNPENPQTLSSYPLVETPNGIAMQDSILYVANHEDGLLIMDVYDPENPVELSTLESPSYCYGVEVRDGLAYVANYSQLDIVDVHDPLLPVTIGTVALGGANMIVRLSGDVAYVTAKYHGVHAIDISDPLDPVFLGTAQSPFQVTDVCPAGERLLYSDTYAGIFAAPVDCLDNTAVFLSRFDLQDLPGEVNLYWETEAGSNPALFRVLVNGDRELEHEELLPGVFRAVDRHEDLATGGRFEYSLFATEDGAFWNLLRSEELDLLPAGNPTRLLGAFPNPFNPRITLKFVLAEQDRARLSILDVSGREVIVLADRVFESGEQELLWDGRDKGGRNMSSGLYFLRMQSGKMQETEKLLLIR